jgi:uncharacterized protein YeaO (DUF488 family)
MRCRPRSIFPRSAPRRQPNARVPSFGEGRAGESNVSTVPPAWCQARLRAARGLGRHEGARRPHLAARAHEGACQRRHVKDIAPSSSLRSGFGHDPNRWCEFHKRYFEELRANHAAVEHLTDLVSTGSRAALREVALLFGAHDAERNNAMALANYLAAH